MHSLGPRSALNRTQAATGIANLSTTCTPIVVAFLLSANTERGIYLGHTCTVASIYPGDPLLPTLVDDGFIVLVGSQAKSCIALALNDDVTRKVNAAQVVMIADILVGHQANPIALRVPFGASQDVMDVRRVLVLPPTISGCRDSSIAWDLPFSFLYFNTNELNHYTFLCKYTKEE